MKGTVRKVDVKKGVKDGKDYLFTSVFVVFDDKITAANVTVDHTVCHPDKIKQGSRVEFYTSLGNKNRATVFEILGAKDETEVDSAGYVEMSPEDFDVDVSTGEAIKK